MADVSAEPTEPTDDAGSGTAAKQKMTWGDRLRWVFWRHLPFGGLAGALVLFCVSATPSLLPRAAVLQGAVAGITMVIGYGLGSAASSLTRKVISSEPGAATKRVAWWTIIVRKRRTRRSRRVSSETM